MSKHTPGPWHHTGREFNDVRDSDDELVAVALHLRVGQPERSVQEAEANARMIAAAPDLLEALSSIDIYLSDTLSGRVNPDPATYKQWLIDGIAEARNRARAAIAKATGETNDQN